MDSQTELNFIKSRIRRLYESGKEVCVNISLPLQKISLKNARVKITGVYSHIFRIEENESGKKHTHTLQYSDVLLGNIEIVES